MKNENPTILYKAINKLFNRTSKELEALKDKAISLSSSEARQLKTNMEGDYPVTVWCYGEEEKWNSAYLALHFFHAGAMACEGSEASRYWSIVCDLECGKEMATDTHY